mgnify:CR=1 FL=1
MMYDWSMESNYSTSLKGSKIDVVCAWVGGANTTPICFLNFIAAYFAKRNLSCGDFEKRSVPKPARIPPQTPPAGGNTAEAGRIHIPSRLFRPAESIQISSSGFSAKYIRTLSNKYRQVWDSSHTASKISSE